MIAFLRGNLLHGREDYLVIDVNGVGYRVFVPSSTMNRLPAKGEEVSVHIYTAVREDAIILYGFQTEAELELFKLLISVTGIGPKVAIGILSAMDVATFKRAIIFEDLTVLKKTPGIGEKTAKRLILELKSKIELDHNEEPDGAPTYVPVKSAALDEAIDALMTLGYSRVEAAQAAEQVKDKDDVEEIIRQALKYLGQGRKRP